MATFELEETPVPEADSEPTADTAPADAGGADGPWENDEDEDTDPAADGD